MPTRVAVLVGSLRSGSFSRKIAKALIARAPKSLACEIVEIGDLPLYNEDLDASPPAAWTKFREEMKRSRAVLFVTPEYNRSIPGGLKNAIDVGSRPEGESVFDGMPAGVVSVTPYKLGAFGANHALRQTFVFLNMLVMQQPEAYLGNAKEIVGDDGAVKDEKAGALLDKFMTSFERWVGKVGEARGEDFEAFMNARREAARDFVNGDVATLERMLTKGDPATFLSPGGDVVRGADAIAKRYASDATSFAAGGTTKLEIFQSGASGDLAFWTGLQHAEAKMKKGGDKVPMTLRITEVFRREGDGFKLVHRHAEMPGEKKR